MRTAFEREGDVRSVDLTGALATLWRERGTGVLAFSHGSTRVRFEILEGDLVGAFSSDPSFETAEVLIRAGKLDAAALRGRRFPPGRDRARAARELGVLTERDWRWGEKIRAVEILAYVIGWLEGRYSFDPGEQPEPRDFRLGIERLLLELFLRSRDREFVHRSLGTVDAPLQRAADFEERFRALGLTTDANEVVEAIDGRTTAAEISRRVGPDAFSVEKLLAALTTLGLAHPEYAAPSQPKRVVPATAPPPPSPAPAVEPEPEPPELPPPPEPEPVPSPAKATIRSKEAEPPGPLEKPVLEEAPIELPLLPAPEPSEAEPALTSWEPIPPEPLDQPFVLAESPEFVPSSRPGLSPIWLLLVLAIAVGALLVFRSRQGGSATTSAGVRGAAVAAPTRAASPAAALGGRPSGKTAVATRPTEAPATPVLSMTATLAPTAIPPTVAARPKAPVPRDLARWMTLAERDLRAVQRDRRSRYAIQLELVCEPGSLDEAWRYDRGDALWLLRADFRGRECFRVLWGRYATLDGARAAKSSVPRFFFTPANQPAVVSIRALLP